MKLLAVQKVTSTSYNYTDRYDATGFSSDDDDCDDDTPGPPTGSTPVLKGTRNWELCK